MTLSARKTVEERHQLLRRKVGLYCAEHHNLDSGRPCDECLDLLAYERRRLERCPHDPKPRCKDCRTHCYGPNYRGRIRAVMRFAGAYHAGDGGRVESPDVPVRNRGSGRAVSHG